MNVFSEYYPVLIPTLNRYNHFKNCVESLAACTHADKTELVIGLDYPPAEKYVEGWKQIKEYIPTIKGFKKVTVFERTENYGSSKNSLELQNYASEHYDALIYTEDDNVFSPCFLDFMNQALNKYKDDESIEGINGSIEPIEWNLKESFKGNVVRLNGIWSAWGCGMWTDKRIKRQSCTQPGFTKKTISSKSALLKLFNSPRHLNLLFNWLQNKELDRPCDVTTEIYMKLNNESVLVPTVSLVRNEGYDGSGEHCGDGLDKYSKQKISNELIYNINEDKENLKLSKRLTKKYEKIMDSNVNNSRNFIRLYIVWFLYFFFGYNSLLFFRKIKTNIKRLCH